MRLLKKKPKKSSKSELPRHIAIIMDGNGRWAKLHRFSRVFGHEKGARVVRDIVTHCKNRGISFLTLYAFSEENWHRPSLEIHALMRLLKKFLVSERNLLMKNQVRLQTIGDIQKLPEDVRKVLSQTMEWTKNNHAMTLILALSYGGRNEIARAVQKLGQKIQQGILQAHQIDEVLISQHLDTAMFPNPDLVIRTSGEFRMSNFLPWQTTYSEWYITPTLWPDFTPQDLELALQDFAKRERRFGLISEQLQPLGTTPCQSGT